MYTIVGLGNPGEKYELTRHNTGRIAVEQFWKKNRLKSWEFDKKLNTLKSQGEIGREKILLVLPETYMNKSGLTLKKIITSQKKAKELIVVHDDIDLPLGKFKISFGKSSAGHKGIESIIKNIKTKDFARIRIGISPQTPKKKVRKPKQDELLNFLTQKFKPQELAIIKRLSQKTTLALEAIIADGLQKAMGEFN
jgi:PTH1 family peptidyl-tRNA hydrolase